MAQFSVSYIFSLIDRFSPGAGKLNAAAQAMSKAVHTAGAATNAAAMAVARYGTSAARTASQLMAMNKAAMASAAAMKRSQGAGLIGRYQGGGGVLGAIGILGGGMMGRNIINQAREASKAENKFRALVDSTTEPQMQSLRESIFKQMGYTGEQYATLMDAAADAAQIVGNADLARGIMTSASSLARIDTAGKDTAFFANSLASVVGPDGTTEDVVRISDMMAKQQKLGAATAGGSIEAYKNVAGLRTLTGFDPTAMFAAFGIMKNVNSAIKDGEMGTWAKYGVRMMALPNAADAKKLKGAGLNTKSFLDQNGNFDIAKAHEILYNKKNAPGGEDALKKLFSGRNINAQNFWGLLLTKSPAEFRKFMDDLIGSQGTLWQAVLERSKDLDGALTRLEGTSRKAGIGIGTWLAPAVTGLALSASDALDNVGPMLTEFANNYPMLSQIAQYAVLAAGGLVALAIPMAAIGFIMSASGLGTMFAVMARGVMALAVVSLAPFVTGIAGAAAGMARAATLAYRFAGAAGVARLAFRMLGRALGIGLAVEGLVLLYNHWERVKLALSDPMKLTIEWPDMPPWLKWIMGNTGEQNATSTPGDPAHTGGLFSDAMKRVLGSAADATTATPDLSHLPAMPSTPGAPPVPTPNPNRPNQTQNKASADTLRVFESVKGVLEAVKNRLPPTPATPAPMDLSRFNFAPDLSRLPSMPSAPGTPGAPPVPVPNPNRVPAAAAEAIRVESTIRGEIAPLQVTATPITVRVTGQVNGPLTGTGSGTLTTNAPRGVSTSEAGSSSVSP